MTQPDQLIPPGTIASTGLAALAIKTQQQWTNEFKAPILDSLDPLQNLFELIDTAFRQSLDTIVQFFDGLLETYDNLDDWLAAIPGISPIVQAITGNPGDINDLADFFTNFPTAGAIIDALTGLQNGTIQQLITWKNNLPLAQTVLDALTGLTNGTVQQLQSWKNGLALSADIFSNGQFIAQKLPELTTTMITGLTTTVGGVTKITTNLIPPITAAMTSGVFETVGGVTRLVKALLPTLAPADITGLLTGAGLLNLNIDKDRIQNLFDQNGKLIQNLLPTITTAMVTGLTQTVNGVTTIVKALLPPLLTTDIQGLLDQGNKLVKTLLPPLLTTDISGLINQVTGKIVTGLIPELSAGLITSGTMALDRVANLVTELSKLAPIDDLVEAITGFSGQNDLTSLSQFFDGFGLGGSMIEQLSTSITAGSARTLAGLGQWVRDELVQISTLVGVITNGVGTTYTDLAEWAGAALTTLSQIDASQIIGQLADGILGVVPISHIGEPLQYPNLLQEAAFADQSSIEAADGWSWDSTQNYVGAGGSAKVTCNATNRQLFANQVIPVARATKMQFSCWVRTSGFTGSGSPIQLTIVPFGVPVATPTATPVQLNPIVLASRAASNNTWAQMVPGVWTVPDPYTVAGVTYRLTSIRVRLAVTSSASAGTVWFDNVEARKIGLLEQSYSQDLVAAWNGLYDGMNGLGAVTGSTTPGSSTPSFTAGSGVRATINTNNTRVTSSITNAVTALLGEVPGAIVDNLIYDANIATSRNITSLQGLVQALNNQQAVGGTRVGRQFFVDFSTYPNGQPSTPWLLSYHSDLTNGTNSGTVQVQSGRVKFVPSGVSRRRGILIHRGVQGSTPAPGTWQNYMLTDYHRVSAVMPNNFNYAVFGNTTTAAYLYARTNFSALGSHGHPTVSVFAKFYVTLNGIIPTMAVELWYTNAVGIFRLNNTSGQATTFFTWRPGATYTLEAGTPSNVKQFRVYQDSTLLATWQDNTAPNGSTRSMLGADFAGSEYLYRYCGFGLEASADLLSTYPPPEVAAWAAIDNQPATTLGSGFRISRVDTNSSGVLVSASGGQTLPAGVFTANNAATPPEYLTDDLKWDPTTLACQVSVSGWYLVELRYELAASLGGSTLAPAVYRSNTLCAVGAEATGTANNCGAHFTVYLTAGQTIRPGYVSNANTNVVGNAAGTITYFSVAFLSNTTPRNPVAT